MKLIQFTLKDDLEQTLRIGGSVDGIAFCELESKGTMRDLIRRLDGSQAALEGLEARIRGAEASYTREQIRLLSPLTDPDKIICIGLNYADHVKESKMQTPKVPVLFPKYRNSLIGDGDAVVIPRDVQQCDYEAELAFIVGRTAKHVPIEEAMNYVFGYTIVNDVSARDIQLNEPQWTRGKAIDTFAPTGPWIVTADEISDPHRLDISLKLNGEVMQSSNTKELIFNVPYLLSFLSKTITLQPGDIISTGTPFGVGMGRNPQVWLKDGDVTEIEIANIGLLSTTYEAEKE